VNRGRRGVVALNPRTWVAEAIIDEIEALSVTYQTAAADYRAGAEPLGSRSAEQLETAAQTCVEIMEMVRREYLL
jgi:hypothetical protein